MRINLKFIAMTFLAVPALSLANQNRPAFDGRSVGTEDAFVGSLSQSESVFLIGLSQFIAEDRTGSINRIQKNPFSTSGETWKAVDENGFQPAAMVDTVLNRDRNATYYEENANYGEPQSTTTPEPASMAILGVGVFGLFSRRRRKLG